MPTDVYHFEAQDLYRAVHRGIGLIQLGHDPADGGLLFDQVDLASVGQFSHIARIQEMIHHCGAVLLHNSSLTFPHSSVHKSRLPAYLGIEHVPPVHDHRCPH